MPDAPPDHPGDLNSALHVLSGLEGRRLRLACGANGGKGRVLERYAAVPSLADPRALLPLDASRAALRTALGQHASGAASPFARAAAVLLQQASRIGLVRPLLQSRVSVEALHDDLDETPMFGFLRDVLGRSDFVMSFRLAPRRPNGKPVVQVVSSAGAVLAYAKFGWEPLTRRLVRHESAVLRELRQLTQATALRVPQVIHSGEWQGLEVLVLAPLEGGGKSPRSLAELPVEASNVLAGASPQSVERLGDSAFWRRTDQRMRAAVPLLPASFRDLALEALRSVEAHWADAEMRMGRIHGDWIPPNIRVGQDGRFNVYDWERSAAAAPLGIDSIQFILYLELLRRRPDLTADGRFGRCGAQALSRQGIDPDQAMLLALLSLLETILWFAEARQAGREQEHDARFANALAAVLRQPRRRSRSAWKSDDGMKRRAAD